MVVRLTLKKEVLETREELKAIKAKENPSKAEAERLEKFGRLLQLRRYIEVPDHAVQGYTGEKDGAYKIARGEGAGGNQEEMAAIAEDVVRKAMEEVGIPSKEEIAQMIDEAVDKALNEPSEEGNSEED